jgi:hypothetical protein
MRRKALHWASPRFSASRGAPQRQKVFHRAQMYVNGFQCASKRFVAFNAPKHSPFRSNSLPCAPTCPSASRSVQMRVNTLHRALHSAQMRFSAHQSTSLRSEALNCAQMRFTMLKCTLMRFAALKCASPRLNALRRAQICPPCAPMRPNAPQRASVRANAPNYTQMRANIRGTRHYTPKRPNVLRCASPHSSASCCAPKVFRHTQIRVNVFQCASKRSTTFRYIQTRVTLLKYAPMRSIAHQYM